MQRVDGVSEEDMEDEELRCKGITVEEVEVSLFLFALEHSKLLTAA